MISVIIVAYNSCGHIGSCLESLENSGAEIVVVDNASTDGTADLIRQFFPSVKLLEAPRNLGFAAASNLGARNSSGSAILFLNPDVVCLGPLHYLEGPLQASEKTVAVAARLVDGQGRTQIGFNVRRLPTPASLIFELLLLNRLFPNNPVNRRYRCLDLDHERPAEVEQPAGACLLVRRESLEQCGFFDEGFFPLWFEDVDLCRRLRQQGGRIWFWPKIAFRHAGAHTVDLLPFSKRRIYWYRNLLYYVRKHFSWKMALAVRAALVGGMGLRLLAVLLGCGGISRVSVPDRGERIATYCKAAQLSIWGWKQLGARCPSSVASTKQSSQELTSRLGSDKERCA
jgi:GT2 family glycosyltransferase